VETLVDFYFHKLHNMTNVVVQILGFYRARFSFQSLFETTTCPLKRQHENHTSVLASDSSHEYTGGQLVKQDVQKNSINPMRFKVMD